MNTYHVQHVHDGRPAAALPPDRALHDQAVRTVLSWSAPHDAAADEIAQAGLLLTGAARVVADTVRTRAARLPEDDGRRLFAELILHEADTSLTRPCTNLHQVQGRARLIRALYERLDRLDAATETATTAP
ncbi:restriction endonuclease [Streptomyces tremellae]|uniref:DUF6415 family natural product biosynthesis protein n=1 Tax=Streptomyces tremellae TaxID=1124239 RepID=A0ABP7GBM1_9ACTN